MLLAVAVVDKIQAKATVKTYSYETVIVSSTVNITPIFRQVLDKRKMSSGLAKPTRNSERVPLTFLCSRREVQSAWS